MTGREEVGSLVVQLGSLCQQADGLSETLGSASSFSQEVFRLLHSIKSWASLIGQSELGKLCHAFELRLRDGSQLSAVFLTELQQAIPGMKALVASEPGGSALNQGVPGNTEPKEGADCFFLSAALPLFDSQEARRIASLRAEGSQLRWCRIWISPDETLPITRLMVLFTRLETLGLVKAEAWLNNQGHTLGPFDPADWVQGRNLPRDWAGRGGWLRALYVVGLRPLRAVIQMDQIEDVQDSTLAALTWFMPDLLPEPRQTQVLSRQDIAVQLMLSEDSSTDSNSRELLLEVGRRPLGPWLVSYINDVKAALLPEPAFQAGVRWQLYDEDLRLSNHTLQVLGEVIGQLLRNTAVHGAQNAAERRRFRKSQELRVGISAWEDGERIFISYQDDGAGIDVAAVETRLQVSTGTLVDEIALLAAISQAGLSTRQQVDLVAGQGIGLNLVKQLSENCLQGQLSLRNWPGLACAFTLDFPRDLADLAIQLIHDGQSWQAVPQVLVAGWLNLDSDSVRRDRQGGAWAACAGQHWPLRARFELGVSTKAMVIQTSRGIRELLAYERYAGSELVLVRLGDTRVYSRMLQDWVGLFS